MVGVVITGRSFGNRCNYVLTESKSVVVLAAHGVRAWSAEEMAADFELQQRLRPSLECAVLHVALAWPQLERDQLSDQRMRELSEAYLREMAIDPAATQWVAVRHQDRPHPHCHLIVNRVDNNGKVLSDAHTFERSHRACRTVEKQFGLVDAVEIGLASDLAQAKKGELPPYETARAYVHDALLRHRPAATSVPGLAALLAGENITLHATYRAGQLRGVVFEREGQFVKGSAISRELGGPQLDRQLQAQAAAVAAQQVSAAAEATVPGREAPVPTPLPGEPLPAVSANSPTELAAKATPVEELAEYPAAAQPAAVTTELAAESAPAATSPGRVEPLIPAAVDQVPASSDVASATGAPAYGMSGEERATVYREAAAGDWDSLDRARHLMHDVLAGALAAKDTDWLQLVQVIRDQGFGLKRDMSQLRHLESGLTVDLVDVQPGGSRARPFQQQLMAAAEANRAAEWERTRGLTQEKLTDFLRDRPHFVDLEQLASRLRPYGLTAHSDDSTGGQVAITHLALGYQFSHKQLEIGGQPLLPQLEAAQRANWANPVQQVEIRCRNEQQAARIQHQLREKGFDAQPAAAGQGPGLLVSYRLDSPEIAQLDIQLQGIKQVTGAVVVEGAAQAARRGKLAAAQLEKQPTDRSAQRDNSAAYEH